jgi:uncharacterized protein YdeI (YjbR/CyaY-like superfamily)
MAKSTDYHEFRDREQWRMWLADNHSTATEAWLILYKVKHQDQGLGLEEAIEEALCFGWIDGTLRSQDEKCFALRFSPRTHHSIWSMSNIRRVEKLSAEGKMTPAGQSKIDEAKHNGEWAAAIRREQVDRIPEDLENELQRKNGALSAYRALPDSRKKQYLYWLQSAKREDTRKRRVQRIIAEIINP